jgi:polyhydroxyalkanoate synthesis regulator phasin
MSNDDTRSREGFRAWLGVLDAFKEAIEETIQEIRERGGPSPERAREAMRSTLKRAQAAVDEARERLDFVPRREFEALREEVAELKRRVANLEGGAREIPVEGA